MAGGHLDHPFSPAEREQCRRAYVQHQGLVRTIGRQFCRRYGYLDRSTIYSAIDIAFLKAFRAWDPAKGRFSTIFAAFARGEVHHYIRDHHGLIRLPRAHQTLLAAARRLLGEGMSLRQVITTLDCDRTVLLQALRLSQTMHNTSDNVEAVFCHRPQPMELLEAETT